MSKKLITVFLTNNQYEAEIIKQQLLMEGISSSIVDEHLGGAPYFSSAVGGIKIQVNQSDYYRSKEIINEYTVSNDTTVAKVLQCPRCDSTNTKYKKTSLLIKILSIFTFGMPLFFRIKKFRCNNCNYQWDDNFIVFEFIFGFILLCLNIFIWLVILDRLL